MGVETAADRAVFVNPADFGVTATYTPVAGSPSSVNGIKDAPWVNAQVEAFVGVESTHPTFLAETANLPGVTHGATLVIAGVTFKVRGVQDDGTGFTVLILEKQ
jgi:hypothetical protein